MKSQEAVGATLAVLLFTFIAVWSVRKWQDKDEVRKSFDKTQGWILSYWDRHYTDAGSGRTIRYGYRVKDQFYSRQIYTMAKFNACDDSIGKECSKKRFWVIFATNDPSKSLINFEVDINEIEDPAFPNNLDDFE